MLDSCCLPILIQDLQYGKEVPLYTASQNGQTEIVHELLKAGADPNVALGEDRDTPLMVACCFGYLAVAKLLLYFGADSSLKNSSGETALAIASSSSHETAAVIELLESSANTPNLFAGLKPSSDDDKKTEK